VCGSIERLRGSELSGTPWKRTSVMLKNLVMQLARRTMPQGRAIDNFAEVAYYDESDLSRWITEKSVFLQHDYMEFPALVHIETLAQCNASCTFCPYVSMERKGTRMPDSLIEKVIDDLTAIP
jgi:sulfatase maturation enzyme AslB (radical SAM superfamily)